VNTYAAVVVLYQPNDQVYENMQTYMEEVSCVYVLDNSTKPNVNLIDKIKRQPKCRYFSMHGNIGLAAALNKGCKIAKEEQYDFILTMDQDSYFREGSVAKMIAFLENEETDSIAIVAPNVTAIYPDPQTGERKKAYVLQKEKGIYEQTWVMTSGSMMRLSFFEEVGGFDETFFIAHIDVDLGIRFCLKGYKTFMVGDAMIYQRFGNSLPKKILWKTVYPWYEAPVRTYYLFRNHTYMLRKYGKKIKKKVHVSLLNHIVKIILFEDKKCKKLVMAWRGWRDGIHGRMGKYEAEK